MNFEFDSLDEESIGRYKRFLYQQIANAIYLPYRQVNVNGQSPQPNNCHWNAQTYEDENQGVECTRGWLVVDGGDLSLEIILLAHSVVREADGNLYEITPIQSCEPRPFLASHLTEENFTLLHQYLATSQNDVRLVILK